jgi:hypothetical protein
MIKLCIECKKEFNTRIHLDGKIVRCDKRKKCFDCFPYAPCNSRTSKANYLHDQNIVCYICSTTFVYNQLIPSTLCPNCRGDRKYHFSCKICGEPFKINQKQIDIKNKYICSACIKDNHLK